MKTPPYVYKDKDRQGRVRYIFRRKGVNRTIKHSPADQAFWDIYRDLMGGAEKPKPIERSFLWLVNTYLKALERAVQAGNASPSTLKQRKSQLTRTAKESDPDGQKDAFALQARHVRVMLSPLADRPGEANNTRKSIRAMYEWAIASGLCEDNPTDAVKPIKSSSNGFTAWTLAEVRQFIHHHPLGSYEYLAIMLALFTGARRSDLPTLGPGNLSGGKISFTPQKKNASPVSVPIHPQLQEAIDAIPVKNATCFLPTKHGKPRTHGGMGNWFGQAARDAGLRDRSLHGLRKAQGTILAEIGVNQYEIMAIQGHTNTNTSQIYTRAADRGRLAEAGMERLSKVRI